MNSRSLMQTLYKIFTTDEIILRLLYYAPKNLLDNPLEESTSKPNILEMTDVLKKQSIIDKVLVPRDKQLELDIKDKFNRINFYLGNKIPKRSFSGGFGRTTINPNFSEQEVVIDINVNMDIDKIDWRLAWISDRVKYLMKDAEVKQLITLTPERGYSIDNTARGFVGYRLTYYTVVTENMGCDFK